MGASLPSLTPSEISMGQLNSILLIALGVCAALWAIRNLWQGERGDGVTSDPLINAALPGGCRHKFSRAPEDGS
jgi:hypothetical protein